MARKVPASPARADAALDQVLDKAPRPAMPPGLAARIVAQATALRQLPAEPVPQAEPAPSRETAQVIPFAVQEPSVTTPSRKRFAVGGFAAIAATVAAVVLLGQSGQSPVPSGVPAAVMAQQQPEAGQPAAAPAAVMAEPTPQLARAPAAQPARQAVAVAGTQADAPVPAPAVQPAVEPEAQMAAAAAPAPRETAGPKADPSARPSPPRGLMGPPAPQQGWGFSGGAPGGTLPGGQSLPSQTTGTAPPPPPPSGN